MRTRHTWEDVKKIAEAKGVTCINLPETGDIFDVRDPGVWKFKCKCGRDWSPPLGTFIKTKRGSNTCGNCDRWTYGKIADKIKNYFDVIKLPGEIDEPVINVNKVFWDLICKSCGDYFTTTTADLRDRRKSCGCKHTLKIAGKKFGRLEAVRCIGKDKNGNYIWQCKCECGNIVEVVGRDLKNKHTTSCSCYNKEITSEIKSLKLDGQIFGKIEISKRTEKNINGNWKWEGRCNCGNSVEVLGASLKSGETKSCGCTKSHTEAELINFVQSVCSENIIPHDRATIRNEADNAIELDILIPNLNLAIELDGLYWHGEALRKTKGYDKLGAHEKYLKCKEKGIRLVTIFEDEWKLKRSAVEGYLSSILNKKKTIGARKCQIIEQNASDFLDQHHLQASGPSGKTYTLVYNNEIIAAAVFCKAGSNKRMGLTGQIYELTRYCVTPELSISGGMSRLLKYFTKENPCTAVISYSDNRWSVGKMYKSSGFVNESSKSIPSYWYIKKSEFGRQHRFNYRKDELIRKNWLLPDETEWECMQRMGYDRVWDCGKTRWVYYVNKSAILGDNGTAV